MESRDLRIFRTVAHQLSFSKAAEEMGYVQSNVTIRIRKLEEELNTPLFERNNKGVKLLPAGEKLLSYADQIIDLLEMAKNDVSPGCDSRSLRLGAPQTLAANRLPLLLGTYSKEFPDVTLSIRTGTRDHLISQVMLGELDGAFVSGDLPDRQIQSVFKFGEEVGLVSCEKYADRNELFRLPVIINSAPDCPYRQLLFKWFDMHGCSPVSVLEFDTLESILSSVKQSMGIALLPISVVPDGLNITRLPEDLSPVIIRFIVRKAAVRSRQLNDFIEIAEETGKNGKAVL
ncbi:LysR family transcriptional regulator [Paenibacillus caui]|uniref:LysR family transcriptional regulator n=1 Tax=Paenibacillus caui TaxID=2873927 RepID=UPI001CAA11C8